MIDSIIDFSCLELEHIRSLVGQRQLAAIRQLLPDSVVWNACRSTGYSFRRRLLTPLVTVLHYLSAALWPQESFQAAAASASLAASSGSLSKARKRLPTEVMEEVQSHVAATAQYICQPRDCQDGFRVVCIDGTCLSMENSPELSGHFGIADTRHGKGKYPQARLVTACVARTGVILSHHLGPYKTSEQAMVPRLVGSLRRGDLLVGDSHFAGSNLYFCYLKAGLEFITPVHQRLKTNLLREVSKLPDGSFTAVMNIWASHRRKYPELPASMRLRFVPVDLLTSKGRRATYLATSLLDDVKQPADSIRRLYSLRWSVETAFRDLKHALSADVLRSRSVECVYKEVAAKITALNLMRCLMFQAAMRHGADASRLSFAQCRRAAVVTSLMMSLAPEWMLGHLPEYLFSQIVSVLVPSRPNRKEPRAVRREKKHFPRLKLPRAQWRAIHALVA